MPTDQKVVDRLEAAIAKGESVDKTAHWEAYRGSKHMFVSDNIFSEWRNQSLNLLISVLTEKHSYTKSFESSVREAIFPHFQAGQGILKAVLEDWKNGNLTTVKEMVHADMFANFLDMADYLMTEDHGYKDAAAVLAGGVLEEHLRNLCQKHGISETVKSARGTEPKKAAAMNSELYALGVYNKIDMQSVTSWQAIRNDAAHAKYANYTREQVVGMLNGIRDFVARNPA